MTSGVVTGNPQRAVPPGVPPRPGHTRVRAPGAAPVDAAVGDSPKPENGTGAGRRTIPIEAIAFGRRGPPVTSRKSSHTKCSSMKRSCSAVPQRHGAVERPRQNRDERAAAIVGRGLAHRAAERAPPTRPRGRWRSGENSLSMVISARWYCPGRRPGDCGTAGRPATAALPYLCAGRVGGDLGIEAERDRCIRAACPCAPRRCGRLAGGPMNRLENR